MKTGSTHYKLRQAFEVLCLVCLFVCLSVYISQKPHNCPNFAK